MNDIIMTIINLELQRGAVMKFIKLNTGWDAEPNAPMPKIEIDKSTSKLKNSF